MAAISTYMSNINDYRQIVTRGDVAAQMRDHECSAFCALVACTLANAREPSDWNRECNRRICISGGPLSVSLVAERRMEVGACAITVPFYPGLAERGHLECRRSLPRKKPLFLKENGHSDHGLH